MEHLLFLFERERQIMMFDCQKKIKQKKSKTLYLKIVAIDEVRRDAVLEEYFRACKMVYRIKATLNYTWNVKNSCDDIMDLFTNDATFQKMQDIVKNSLMNVLSTTDPNEPVLGDLNPKRNSSQMTRRMTKVLKSAKTIVLPPPEPPKIIEKKMNKYDLVDHLIP